MFLTFRANDFVDLDEVPIGLIRVIHFREYQVIIFLFFIVFFIFLLLLILFSDNRVLTGLLVFLILLNISINVLH